MLAGLALATVAFVVVLALTFPTDALVRWALTRALPAGGRAVGFERAHLRPWGLELDGVEVRNPDGTVAIHADWLTLRPSLSGLVGDGHTGRPWHARMAVCAGTVDALADRDTTGDVANVTWTDINLAGCPGRLSLATDGASGISTGHARVTGSTVEGETTMRALAWTGVVQGLPVLHADTAAVHWTLAGGRLVLDGLAVHGPDLEARGGGSVRLGESASDSTLELVLTVAPGPDAPPQLRNFILHLPGGVEGSDERHVAVTGPAAAPQVVAAP